MLLGPVVTLACEAPAPCGLKFVWQYERSDSPHYSVIPPLALIAGLASLGGLREIGPTEFLGDSRLATVLEALGRA